MRALLWLPAAALVACGRPDARLRVREYFDVPPGVPDSLLAREIRDRHAGAPEPVLRAGLDSAGFAADSFVRYRSPDEMGVAVVRIDEAPDDSLGASQPAYLVLLRFDAGGRLRDVAVRHWPADAAR